MTYNKSQIGWTMIAVFTLIPLQISYSFFKQGQTQLPLSVYIILMIVMIAVLLNFYKLTIKADQSTIQVIFGIGLLNFKIRPKKILKMEMVKTPWYYGLGIRVTPKGMLYNVHGLQAVEITYLDAKNFNSAGMKTVMIGTRDPQNLLGYLESEYRGKL
jgi:hypothetical protein